MAMDSRLTDRFAFGLSPLGCCCAPPGVGVGLGTGVMPNIVTPLRIGVRGGAPPPCWFMFWSAIALAMEAFLTFSNPKKVLALRYHAQMVTQGRGMHVRGCGRASVCTCSVVLKQHQHLSPHGSDPAHAHVAHHDDNSKSRSTDSTETNDYHAAAVDSRLAAASRMVVSLT